MPIRRRRVARRRPAIRRMKRGKRTSKTMNPMKDKARVVEVYESVDFAGNFGTIQQFSLEQFARALAVSKNYRYYRASKVELEFVPFANLFAPGSAFPELFYQQDYTAFIAGQAPTLGSMLGRGVLPVKWTKPIKRSYVPAVLRFEQLYTQSWKTADGAEYYVNDVQPITATPVKNKWYMTEKAYTPSAQPAPSTTVITQVGPSADPAGLLYTGSAWYINTPIPPAGNIGRVFVRVHWEFKQPLVLNASSQSNIDVPLTRVRTHRVDLSGNTVISV